MKLQFKYRALTIPKKLTVDIKVNYDTDRFNAGENQAEVNGTHYRSLTLFPLIEFVISRANDIDENGQRIRLPFNPNDRLGLTRYQLPLFIDELQKIYDALHIKELYSYIGKKLVVDEVLAEKSRRVIGFGIGTMGQIVVEMTPVVIVKPENDTLVEGIKLKFNNEQSSVLLTVNELRSLLWIINTIDIDSIVLMLHSHYYNKCVSSNQLSEVPIVQRDIIDIKPKEDDSL